MGMQLLIESDWIPPISRLTKSVAMDVHHLWIWIAQAILSEVYKIRKNHLSNFLDSSGIPGWPAMIDINQTNIILTASNITQVAQYTCGRGNSHYSANTAACSQFSNQDSTLTNTANWRPYVLHPKILNAEFATDAFKYIVYECSFCRLKHYKKRGWEGLINKYKCLELIFKRFAHNS